MLDTMITIAGMAALVAVMAVAAAALARWVTARPEHWLITRVGHRWWSVAVAYVITFAPHPSGTAWELFGLFVGAALLTVILGADRAHARTICSACIEAWPLDAPAQAEQRKSWLTYWHRSTLINVAAIVTVITLSTFLHVVPSLAALGAYILVISLTDRARAIHTPLQPWCPVCGDNDGHDDTTVPDPEPSATRR